MVPRGGDNLVSIGDSPIISVVHACIRNYNMIVMILAEKSILP